MKKSVVVLSVLAALSASVFAQDAKTSAIDMVLIKGGEYLMGSPADEFERQKDEVRHKVKVNDFMLARYELSQALYRKVMGANPWVHVGSQLPVENISWFDAVRFCNALSKREGLTEAYTIRENGDRTEVTWNRSANGYRLPTEAEWEYAARAGTVTPFNTGENVSADQANYYGTYPYRDGRSQLYREKTVPVTSFSANAWGLFNMHGNVWEWCWDRYGRYSTEALSDNPTGPEAGRYRVNRGGGYNDFGKHLRSAYRAAHTPENKTFNLGMRLARNAR